MEMLWVASSNSQRKQRATWRSHPEGNTLGAPGPQQWEGQAAQDKLNELNRWFSSRPSLRINFGVFTCFLFKCSVLESQIGIFKSRSQNSVF